MNEIRITVKGDNDAKPALSAARKDTKDLGDQAKETSRDLLLEAASAKVLDRQISETTEEMRRLAVAIAATGDEASKVELQKRFDVDASTRSQLQRMRKLFADEGGQSGKEFTRGFWDTLRALPSELKGAAIVGAVGVTAVMAPFIGSAIGGAVLGGVGAGGIIGGIALAAQDSRIQAEAKHLGDQVMSQLTSGAGVFVNPILDALRGLTPTSAAVTASIGRDFAVLAPLITPVTRGLDGMARNILPGLEHAVSASRAPIRGLANELPELGDAVSDALSAISDGSDEGTAALIGLVDGIGWTIRQTGEFIHILETEYGWLRTAGNAIHDFTESHGLLGSALSALGGGALAEFSTWMDDQTTKTEAAKDATGDYAGVLRGLGINLQLEAELAAAASEALEQLTDVHIGAADAAVDQRQGLRKLVDDLEDVKNKTLDNSEAGDTNKEAIIRQVGAIEHLREANIANGMSVEGANQLAASQLAQLRKVLVGLGFNARAVDDYVNSLLSIPRNVYTTIHRNIKTSERGAEYSSGIGGYAAGGAVSTAQTGGSRGGLVLKDEQGPELTTLPNGSVVVPAGMSRQLMQGWAGGGGGRLEVEVVLPRAGGLAWLDALIEGIRFKVHSEGGNDPMTYLRRS